MSQTLSGRLAQSAHIINTAFDHGWKLNTVDRGTAWHYTVHPAVSGIIFKGQLENHAGKNFHSGIWFSLEPEWEPFANSRVTCISPVDVLLSGEQPYRFGISTLKLCALAEHSIKEQPLVKSAAYLNSGPLGVLLTSALSAVMDKALPKNHTDEKRALTMHYVYPAKTLPIERIDRIERFNGQWVDCKESVLTASREYAH